jgi:acyl carrier protein
MTQIDSRLTKCFTAVFPELRGRDATKASLESMASWDSIATATLLSIVSEEFGVGIDYEIVDQLISYAAIRDYVAGSERLKGHVD